MIRKYARVDVPLELVRQVFLDVESWPEWMPGIQSARVLQSSERRQLVRFRQRFLGIEFDSTIEILPNPAGLRQRQVSGWLRKWDARWRFLQPPDGEGTTISVDLDFRIGFLGFFLSRTTMVSQIDHLVEQTTINIEKRVHSVLFKAPEEGRGVETLLQIFQTATGLEVFIEGHKYQLEAMG